MTAGHEAAETTATLLNRSSMRKMLQQIRGCLEGGGLELGSPEFGLLARELGIGMKTAGHEAANPVPRVVRGKSTLATGSVAAFVEGGRRHTGATYKKGWQTQIVPRKLVMMAPSSMIQTQGSHYIDDVTPEDHGHIGHPTTSSKPSSANDTLGTFSFEAHAAGGFRRASATEQVGSLLELTRGQGCRAKFNFRA